MTDIESKFTEELRQACDRTWSELNYNPQRFRMMLAEHGGVAAAKRILNDPVIGEGFNEVVSRSGMHLTVEWIVQLPKWRHLFTNYELQVAKRRTG